MAKSTSKIQKRIAESGYCSRRQAEKLITEQRVAVDGQIAHIGQRVSDKSIITIDKRALKGQSKSETIVLMYHKPVGQLCTRFDANGRDTVFDHLPPLAKGRWIQIGRLDQNTSGLLLFTNDGELAHRMMHPKQALARVYRVKVRGPVSSDKLSKLCSGVNLSDGLAAFESLERIGKPGANEWYQVLLREGRNKEVRRMWHHVGVDINRLVRIQFGSVTLSRRLTQGQCQKLSTQQLKKLLKTVH